MLKSVAIKVAVMFGTFLVPAAAHACNVVRTYHAAEKVVVVEKKIVVAEYVPVAVAVPVYAVGYAPPAVAAPVASTLADDRVRALEAKLAEMERRLTASAAPIAPSPVPNAAATAPAAQPAGKSVLASRCAACHDSALATAKGGGVTLSASGKASVLTPELSGKVLRAVSRGTMPKGSKLLDGEFNDLLQELVDLQSR